MTQWAFGPGLIDRSFLLTGGVCELLEAEGEKRIAMGKGVGEMREIFTGAACKLAGGQWRGGHDISGHVFLLTLGSAFLGMEILPVVLRYAGLREERAVRNKEGVVGRAGPAIVIGDAEAEKEEGSGVGGAVVVAGLSWWMLLMTAAYFHTWVEKVCLMVLSGWLVCAGCDDL